MTDFLFQYGLFFAKAVTWLAVLFIASALIANLIHSLRAQAADHLEVKNLNQRFRDLADSVKHAALTPDEWKKELKAHKADDKARAKAPADAKRRPRVYVLNFHGDIQASAVESLRDEISAILQVIAPGDEVLARVESPGGVMHGYGFAASQLRRIRDKGVKLTISVDKVAASGGYMMACVADRIIAAPFAILGSIGVVGQLPNFNRLLKKHDVDYELHTAGEYKRTLTLFGENTDAGREKFRESLEEAHELFKAFIQQNRPQVAIGNVATGDHWFGTKALELKLVDALETSDDYLLERSKDCDLYELKFKRHKSLSERVAAGIRAATFLR